MKILKFLFLFLPVLAGCNHVDVYEAYHDSVVMIYHQYVYKLSWAADRSNIYFNYDADTGELTNIYTSLDSARGNAMANFGTGFFIGDDGRIVTNRHVVSHYDQSMEVKVKGFFRKVASGQKQQYDSLKNAAIEQINIWTNEYYNFFSEYTKNKSAEEVRLWTEIRDKNARQVIFWEDVIGYLPDSKMSVETLYLGYASDGSFVKRVTDYKECSVIRISNAEEIDLAVIQSHTKRLPDEVKKYLKISDIITDPPKVNDRVSMLSYNLGPTISVTNTGLNVQNTEGKITQPGDGTRILYTINALSGSSGSPVFSEKGKLVAINYAGYQAQGFNYGILSRHLLPLLD